MKITPSKRLPRLAEHLAFCHTAAEQGRYEELSECLVLVLGPILSLINEDFESLEGDFLALKAQIDQANADVEHFSPCMTNDRGKFAFQPIMTIMVIITSNYGIMNMKTMSAVDAKTRFGQFIDAAQREPVVVTKKDRPVGVFFSIDDIQDTIWGEEAKAADAEGYLTAEESSARINALLDADD